MPAVSIIVIVTLINTIIITGVQCREREEPKVDKVISFKWEIKEFPTNMGLLNMRQEPLTSNVCRNGRALLTQELDLFLQLVSAANPVTVKIR